MAGECDLQSRQLTAFSEPLDCFNRLAVEAAGREEAGADRIPIDEHGATTACALFANGFCPSQPKAVAQDGQEAGHAIHLERVRLAVELELDLAAVSGSRVSSRHRCPQPAA